MIEPKAAVEVVTKFMDACLIDQDVEKALSCVTEDIYGVGFLQNSVSIGKQQLRSSLAQKASLFTKPLPYEFGPSQSKPAGSDSVIFYSPVTLKWRDTAENPRTGFLHMTAVVVKTAACCKISGLHYSRVEDGCKNLPPFPDSLGGHSFFERQNGLQAETFHLLNSSIPGGMMGGYIEPGFPLYFINDEMLNYLGYTYEEFVEEIDGFVSNCMHPDDRAYVDAEVDRQLQQGEEYEIRYRMLKKDHNFIWVLDRGKQIVAEDGRPAIISVCIDVTAMVTLQKELEQLAYVDPVTGGHNKSSFEKLAAKLLRQGKAAYALIYTNVDRFKLINDRFGRNMADCILKHLYTILADSLQEGECCGRLAADNFGILMRYRSLEELEQRLSAINRRAALLEEPKNITCSVQMSYGIYLPEDPGLDIVTMLDRANIARKSLLHSSGVSYGLYNKSMKEQMIREKILEDQMHAALREGQFVVYLQPKYELKGKTIAGAEALVRWQHPADGLLPPNSFIPLFERNGFIIQLDLFVFEQTCKIIRGWLDAGLKPVPISVNLSKANFDIPDFLDAYEAVLKELRIPCEFIEFEFTETLVYDNLQALTQSIEKIHKMGCFCSMDDFGSGYSSLNLLKSIFVDVLKIDRVFFDAPESEADRSKNVIQGVVSLAKSLNLTTVSEGIETMSQVEFLEQIGCDLVQGFVYAKPMPINEFEALCFRTE